MLEKGSDSFGWKRGGHGDVDLCCFRRPFVSGSSQDACVVLDAADRPWRFILSLLGEGNGSNETVRNLERCDSYLVLALALYTLCPVHTRRRMTRSSGG